MKRHSAGSARYWASGNRVRAGAEKERRHERRRDQRRHDAQGARDDVIAPAPAVEAHGDEETGDGEETVHRVLAEGEAGRAHQRLVLERRRW